MHGMKADQRVSGTMMRATPPRWGTRGLPGLRLCIASTLLPPVNRRPLARRVRANVLSAVVLAFLLTLACSRKPRPAPPVVAFAPASSSSAPAPATIGPQGHDLPSLFVASLAEIDLRPAQEADIDAIVRDLRQLRKASDEAVRRLADDTMDGVGAGRLDHFEIDADIERLAQTVDARKPHVQSDIDRLHASLDAQQRRDLFQTMRKKAEAARVSAEREGG